MPVLPLPLFPMLPGGQPVIPVLPIEDDLPVLELAASSSSSSSALVLSLMPMAVLEELAPVASSSSSF